MENNEKKVVIIWSEGFPCKKTAINEKNFLLAKALILAGYDVYLTSKLGYKYNIDSIGVENGVQYINFGQKKRKFILINFLGSIIKELSLISSIKKKHSNVYLIVSYTPMVIYLFYFIFSKISRVNLVLSIMEWHIGAHKNMSFPIRMNSFIFDKYAIRFSKGAIAISEYIISKLKLFSKDSKFLFIPALTDICRINNIQIGKLPVKPYILYCGSIGYVDAINLILDSYDEYSRKINNKEISLLLILSGRGDHFITLRKNIESKGLPDQIQIMNNLSYSDLIKKFKGASVLLAPLQDNVQDFARYPQKIAEYAACGRPIVSNPIGQVGVDFSHKIDIYYADSFNPHDFALAIHEILSNRKMADFISVNAKNKAEKYYDYRNYSSKIDEFLRNLS